MKRAYLIATVALFTGSLTSRADFSLEFFHPFLGGLHGFSNAEGTATNGMYWGIVVNVAGTSNFSGLNNMNADWLSAGIDTSGQWIGTDLIYLTGGNSGDPLSLPTTQPGTGPVPPQGALGTISGIKYTNNPEENGEDYQLEQGLSFAVIWFAIEEGRTSVLPNDHYGYLHIGSDSESDVIGFEIPENNRNQPFFHLANYDGNNPGRVANQTFQAVPEPATYAMLLGGLALGYCAVQRRRSRKAVAV